MDEFWREITGDLPTLGQFLITCFRLLLAALVGALPGIQRERKRVAAGLRTHILVSVGAAMFVMTALQSGASADHTTRVIQGVATGIGFVGGGAILKSAQSQHIRGLTTAASIWLTAALGSAAGLGHIGLPVCGSVLALFVLSGLRRAERSISKKKTPIAGDATTAAPKPPGH